MRLTDNQRQAIQHIIYQRVDASCRIYLFGSRLDDNARGGDIDLLLEFTHVVDEPALMVAQLSARISRAMSGRKVDLLISAPNLRHLPIHDLALTEGQLI